MGVPGLAPWIFDKFPSSVKTFAFGKYSFKTDYLLLDANGLLHSAAQEIYHYGSYTNVYDKYANFSDKEKMVKCFNLFFEKIIRLLDIAIPQSCVYIAIDGPAPLAKQIQQRSRRYKAALERPQTQKFDSNCITPGTTWMHELNKYLHYKIREEMNDTQSRLSNIKVVFSPPSIPGEGEHKIMDYLRKLPQSELKTKSFTFFGPDGDLIMLILSIHTNNINLLRENIRAAFYYELVDGKILNFELNNYFSTKKIDIASINFDVNDSFVLCGFLVGNDFLPHVPMFYFLKGGLNLMCDLSKTTDTLVKNGEIEFEAFKSLISKLSVLEPEYLIESTRGNVPEHLKNKTLTDNIYYCNGIPQLHYDNFRTQYYQKSFGNITPEKLEEQLRGMCEDYMKCLVWIFYYYCKGGINSCGWKYHYKYYYTPLMSDFSKYVNSLVNGEVVNNITIQNGHINVHFEKGRPVKPFVQLLTVLPPRSAGLLPKEYGLLLVDDKSSPLIQNGYVPKEFKIDFEGNIAEHMGIALIKFPDLDFIEKTYERVIPLNDYHRNTLGTQPKVFVRDTTLRSFRSSYGVLPSNRISMV